MMGNYFDTLSIDQLVHSNNVFKLSNGHQMVIVKPLSHKEKETNLHKYILKKMHRRDCVEKLS